jgi:hypothetical protein
MKLQSAVTAAEAKSANNDMQDRDSWGLYVAINVFIYRMYTYIYIYRYTYLYIYI